MRIIKEKTLIEICKKDKYSAAKQSVLSWIYEIRYSNWENAGELKEKYRNASIISSKRVVFNIKRSDYRLIVDIEYKLKLVFVIWFGTHDEYGRIDIKNVRYED